MLVSIVFFDFWIVVDIHVTIKRIFSFDVRQNVRQITQENLTNLKFPAITFAHLV